MKILESTDPALEPLFAAGWETEPRVRGAVEGILRDVRARGDDALVAYTRRFDDPGFTSEQLRVSLPPVADARRAIPETVAYGIDLAHERIASFHERGRLHDDIQTEPDGTKRGMLVRPFAAVGCYVPGGSATLPSSVLMTAVPAKIAGVERVLVTTPPSMHGGTDAAVIYASLVAGVDELYAVGGAQAIAALAFGTPTIARVDKIVGPGNVYVTEAKRQVFGICGIDGLAGPSEVLVVADATADPHYVAGEMLAQAEHDPLARVATVARERALLESVAALLEGDFARETGRGQIIDHVLARGAWLIHAENEAAVLDVIERFAPEHLSLQIVDPWSLVPKIRRAGAIFVGADTPVAAGDYIAGTNHVLPTSGAARFSSGLRTADFYRTMSIVENSRSRMHGDREVLAALANFEGLPAHARTALLRP